ncbi:helix-turn-helix domain-containing protein [Sphingomonas sp. 2R-10]|uniref:TetR/AcrR family transcriptional regulator n=1 Tax=Sphingomonas sp. 2R-10 TaxID=3045148 RepID=UPI000F78554A|nr:TetR/AcrR family transcriptional regulator [Sphingomonas sp. 2R-10]MDJ0277850.1 helix-turn-helix domain-containing protein [Sphingomonas sp. 2R-10]
MTEPAAPRPTRAPRRDAARRREALITAAAARFAEQGYGVPLEAIAAAAGVGRATLYRNFEDREALALAIFSSAVDRLEAMLDPAAPIGTTLATTVRAGTGALSLFARIAADLHLDDANRAAFQQLAMRLETVFAPVLHAAQLRGEVSDEVTSRDLVLSVRMAGSLVLPFMDEDEVSAKIEAALRLLLKGLRPR